MPPLRRVSRRYAQQKAAVLLDVLRVHSLLCRLQDGWAFADSCSCAICTWAFLWNFDNGKQYRRHRRTACKPPRRGHRLFWHQREPRFCDRPHDRDVPLRSFRRFHRLCNFDYFVRYRTYSCANVTRSPQREKSTRPAFAGPVLFNACRAAVCKLHLRRFRLRAGHELHCALR